MKKQQHDKQKKVTAASFKRIAKQCRARARDHKRLSFSSRRAKDARSQDHWFTRATMLQDFANICEKEAAILRAMR